MSEIVGHPVPVDLGNLVSTERPDALRYEFFDYADQPIDLIGGAISFHIQRVDSAGTTEWTGTGATSIESNEDPDDPINSVGQYVWETTDMTAGHFSAYFWVVKNGLEYASKKIVWYVRDGVKVP